MSDKRLRTFNQQTILITSFLAVIAFMGLVLVLQAPDKFRMSLGSFPAEAYIALIIVLLAYTSFASILCSLAMAEVAAGNTRLKNWPVRSSNTRHRDWSLHVRITNACASV